MTHAEEMQLVEAAQHDPQAFGALYDRYYGSVFGFFFHRVGNVDAAKDLTSETFFQALSRRHTFRDRGKPFGSWIFSIASTQAANYFRRRKGLFKATYEAYAEEPMSDAPNSLEQLIEIEQTSEQNVLLTRIRSLVADLPTHLQSILSLRFFANQTIPEIAETLDLKEGTVKSHLHRALHRLRKRLATSSATEITPEAPSLSSYVPNLEPIRE